MPRARQRRNSCAHKGAGSGRNGRHPATGNHGINHRPERGTGVAGAADRQGPPRLQHLGRQRDAGGLRAALHCAFLAQVVRIPRGQHRLRRHLVPAAGGDRRLHHAQLRLRQRPVGDRHGRAGHFPHRPADQLVRGALRRRHGSADPGCRLRLHRLDHHLADLRLVHLPVLRARSDHHGAGAAGMLRHPADAGLPDLCACGDSAGDPRHLPDQPPAGLDPAAVAGDAGAAFRVRHRQGAGADCAVSAHRHTFR